MKKAKYHLHRTGVDGCSPGVEGKEPWGRPAPGEQYYSWGEETMLVHKLGVAAEHCENIKNTELFILIGWILWYGDCILFKNLWFMCIRCFAYMYVGSVHHEYAVTAEARATEEGCELPCGWALGIEPGPSKRADSTFNCWVNSPTQ